MRREFTSNPVADAENHYLSQEDELRRTPKCDICDEHVGLIGDRYFRFDGTVLCEDCLRSCVIDVEF